MKTVNLYEAKTHLSKLVAEIETGEDRVVLCRNGIPIVDMVPHKRTAKHKEPDPLLLGASYLGDPCASLDESDWPEALR